MNKWVSPPQKEKSDELMTKEPINPISFDTIKNQVGKKKVSQKPKKERIADKSVSLAERLGYQTYK